MKNITFPICFTACIALTNAYSNTVVIDDVQYSFETVQNIARITKIDMPNEHTRVVIPDKLSDYSVRSIGKNTMFGSFSQEIVIPGTVTNLHVTAFMRGRDYSYGCYTWQPSLATNVLFCGPAPKLDSSGLTTSYQNWQFKNAKVFVGEDYYSKYYADGDTDVNTYKRVFCGGVLTVGFANARFTPSEGVIGCGDEITITSSNATAQIYYTLDGSEPVPKETDSCHKYVAPIALKSAATIKAIAYVTTYPYAIASASTYAFGKVEIPMINSSLGNVFYASNNAISLYSQTTDATIHYTINGMPVTTNSPIYTVPFAISETTTVRAKAFKEDWFESEETVQTFTRLWYKNETPVISADTESFAAASQEVTLTCDTEDATIYYTIDGSEPSAANGRVYKGPFNIYQTTTVKAIAVKDDWKDSVVVSATFTKANEIGPAINLLEMLPDNDKSHPWTVVTDVTHDGVSAVKSGEISDDESTTMKVVVYGAGELSFWWRTSCEPSIGGEWYDFATFYDGTTVVTNLAGVTDWHRVVRTVEGTGKHTFKWTYQKDGSASTVPDGVWVDQVQWLPRTDDWYSDHTLTTEVPVKYEWLRKYGLAIEDDFETAAKAATGKSDGTGRELTVEDDFVAGTDPTNELSHLEAMIEMTNGVPCVRWTPDLNEDGAKNLRTYKIWGKETLDDTSDWEHPTNSLHHFFKVTVEMP